MKTTIFALLFTMIFGTLAFAVSIDFTSLSAVSISDVATTVSDDGATTSTEISFAGDGLKPLLKLLPKVKDEEGRVIKDFGLIHITNAGQAGVEEDKATAIYLECRKENRESPVDCKITIFKGALPG